MVGQDYLEILSAWYCSFGKCCKTGDCRIVNNITGRCCAALGRPQAVLVSAAFPCCLFCCLFVGFFSF